VNLNLTGQTALVTGSTAGIGFAIAAGFAQEGARVVLNGRSEETVSRALLALRAQAPQAEVAGTAADLGTAEGCERLVRAHPDVDILVNNVGIFEAKPFQDVGDADWLHFLEVNLLSGVRLSRHHLSRMLARGFGRILFISSESGLQIPPEMIHYGVTKTAQIALARGLAELTRGTAVTVNSILPGPTRSDGVNEFVQGLARQQGRRAADVEQDFFRNARPSSLLQRFATPEEVAALVLFVSSARASAVNGAALRVDGGVVRAIP